LLADNTSGSATGSGPVTVNSSATLGGSGTIAGTTTLNSGATLTAGTVSGASSLDFSGTLNANSGSTWLVNLVGTGGVAGTDWDLIQVGGILNLASSLVINDTSWAGYTLYNSYQIASYTTSISGTFAGLGNGSDQIWGSSGRQYQINYGAGFGGSGSGFVTLTAVPEPSQVVAIVLLLALGLWFGRRRLRAQNAAVVEVDAEP
jgi:hypothetical protein